MLLSAYQALYYMWNSYWNKPIPVDHRDSQFSFDDDGIVHCDFRNDMVHFEITREDYDLIRPEISEKEFNHFDEMTPYDAEVPYRSVALDFCSFYKMDMLTLSEFVSVLESLNEKADHAFDVFYVQKEDWKNLGTCCPHCS